MGLRGPKPKPLDLEKLKLLSQLNCTAEEMAHHLGVGTRTIERRIQHSKEIRQIVQSARSEGRISLRRMQFRRAELESKGAVGGATMLVFLGKQLLGQRDERSMLPPGMGTEEIANAVRSAFRTIDVSVPSVPDAPAAMTDDSKRDDAET